MQHFGLFWFFLITNLVAQITLFCNKRLARTVPINFILLFYITMAESYLLSHIVAEYTPESVFFVFVITSAGFLGMSAYAILTKRNLLIHMGVLWGMVIVSLSLFFLVIFTQMPMLILMYAGLGVLFMLIFIAIDTQMIIKGRKYGVGCDDYIVGSLILYLDFLELFLHLLRLFGNKK